MSACEGGMVGTPISSLWGVLAVWKTGGGPQKGGGPTLRGRSMPGASGLYGSAAAAATAAAAADGRDSWPLPTMGGRTCCSWAREGTPWGSAG